MNRYTRSFASAFGAVGLLLACGGGDQGPITYAVQVAPSTVSLPLGGSGATTTISATVTRKSIPDITVPVTWSTSDATVATVAASGQTATITATGHGLANIIASVPGSSATTAVTVVAPECAFGGGTTLTFGVPVTAQLSNADCRRNDLPSKIFRVEFNGGPGTFKVVTTSSAFSPKLTVLNGSLNEVGVQSGSTTACLAGFNLFINSKLYYVIVSGSTPASKGNFTVTATFSEGNSSC